MCVFTSLQKQQLLNSELLHHGPVGTHSAPSGQTYADAKQSSRCHLSLVTVHCLHERVEMTRTHLTRANGSTAYTLLLPPELKGAVKQRVSPSGPLCQALAHSANQE